MAEAQRQADPSDISVGAVLNLKRKQDQFDSNLMYIGFVEKRLKLLKESLSSVKERTSKLMAIAVPKSKRFMSYLCELNELIEETHNKNLLFKMDKWCTDITSESKVLDESSQMCMNLSEIMDRFIKKIEESKSRLAENKPETPGGPIEGHEKSKEVKLFNTKQTFFDSQPLQSTIESLSLASKDATAARSRMIAEAHYPHNSKAYEIIRLMDCPGNLNKLVVESQLPGNYLKPIPGQPLGLETPKVKSFLLDSIQAQSIISLDYFPNRKLMLVFKPLRSDNLAVGIIDLAGQKLLVSKTLSLGRTKQDSKHFNNR